MDYSTSRTNHGAATARTRPAGGSSQGNAGEKSEEARTAPRIIRSDQRAGGGPPAPPPMPPGRPPPPGPPCGRAAQVFCCSALSTLLTSALKSSRSLVRAAVASGFGAAPCVIGYFACSAGLIGRQFLGELVDAGLLRIRQLQCRITKAIALDHRLLRCRTTKATTARTALTTTRRTTAWCLCKRSHRRQRKSGNDRCHPPTGLHDIHVYLHLFEKNQHHQLTAPEIIIRRRRNESPAAGMVDTSFLNSVPALRKRQTRKPRMIAEHTIHSRRCICTDLGKHVAM